MDSWPYTLTFDTPTNPSQMIITKLVRERDGALILYYTRLDTRTPGNVMRFEKLPPEAVPKKPAPGASDVGLNAITTPTTAVPYIWIAVVTILLIIIVLLMKTKGRNK